MTRLHACGVESKASIARHPIHPMLIPFPIAFLIGGLATDIVFWATGAFFWAGVSYWLILAGLVTGAAAAVFGLIDFLSIRQVRRHTAAWVHFLGNGLALVLSLVNVLIRSNQRVAEILPAGMILSALVVIVLGVTGWYGGELSYRYKIGVIEDQRSEVASQERRAA